jgi:hypothetical protein
LAVTLLSESFEQAVKEAKTLLGAYFSLPVIYFYSFPCFTCLPLRASPFIRETRAGHGQRREQGHGQRREQRHEQRHKQRERGEKQREK